MKVYNLTLKSQGDKIADYSEEMQYLVIASQSEFAICYEPLNIFQIPKRQFENIDKSIRFESFKNFDYLSFVHFNVQGSSFAFEPMSVFYGKNYTALVLPEKGKLYKNLLDELDEECEKTWFMGDATVAYYEILNFTLTRMFENLCQYENLLAEMENDIVINKKNYDFEKIVLIKSNCFEAKKCMRLLLYVGDQLVANDNKLIEQNELRFFQNIDTRINRIYDFSISLYEMSEHLIELYNSTVNSQTNDMINRLTIFTVFFTPLSLLTGLYGMNFVNMPELEHQYGYFILIAVMVLITVITFVILKKKKIL